MDPRHTVAGIHAIMCLMRVLVACEFSGRVRDAFIARGHDAISADLLPSETPGPHYQGDCRDLINATDWDLMIAHPPCTYLSNAGVQSLYNRDWSWNMERVRLMWKGIEFFNELLDAPIPRIAVENPVQHRFAKNEVNQPYDQIIHPWMFGHTEQKKTCLWLKDLPALVETDNVYNQMMLLPKSQRQPFWYSSGYGNRQITRSRTYPGIAEAMADQWAV